MAKSRKPTKNSRAPRRRGKTQLYSLEVGLVNGPITTSASNKNSLVSWTIEIRGDQTLEDLHRAVFDAFERLEDYSYEYQFDGGSLHPEGKRYVLPGAYEISIEAENPAAGRVTDTRIDSLGLEVGQHFVYSPDKEDDWWHPIAVTGIAEAVPKGKYPRVLKEKGTSPFGGQKQEHLPLDIGKNEGADTACLVAELHLRQREYHKAIEAFTRAVENNPTVDAYEGRARAYRALAEQDELAAQKLLRG
jgi:hypothetical protein